jgi:hypothetical protein
MKKITTKIENMEKMVMRFDLRYFKKFIRESYSPDHPIQVANQEPDFTDDARELIAKAEVWLRLSHL